MRLFVLILVAAMSSGCGYKGALYLPATNKEVPAEAAKAGTSQIKEQESTRP